MRDCFVRSLCAVLAGMVLVSCASAPTETNGPGFHTGRVWEESDVIVSPSSEPDRWPVGGTWVMVVSVDHEAELSDALYGLPSMPDGVGLIPNVLDESVWQGLGEFAQTDDDGYFDVSIEEGEYWVCMNYSGRPYEVRNCVLKFLGRGEVEFEWVMGNLN